MTAERGERESDLLAAAEGVEQIAAFRAPRCQRVVDGLRDASRVGSEFLHAPINLRVPARCDAYSRDRLGQLPWSCGRTR